MKGKSKNCNKQRGRLIEEIHHYNLLNIYWFALLDFNILTISH